MCISDDQLDCVKKVKINKLNCLKNCNGMDIISYIEFDPQHEFNLISKLSEEYSAFKGDYEFPSKFKGK